jgi:hypothetical protein
MASRIKFARTTTSMRIDPAHKYPTLIKAGSAWWANHPVVKANPGLFADEPVDVQPKGWDPPVEQTTAAPGEKRAGKRGG